ncbi:polyphosphoinositide phosphatase [Ophiostoma piceae UAMH 11346]|uniref:Polyphosphoinositide phosphatase n=1 Tax=Ophiostoma piceae (strain UAMH 11346) TaxID=1262450 RepID=S3CB92_OPHP1|nr:polyphosphoinositide phosphatase [Ophiostoma piceae UAMH 11346]
MAVLNPAVDSTADAASLASSHSTATVQGGDAINSIPANQPFPQLRNNAEADSDLDAEATAQSTKTASKTSKSTKAADVGASVAGDDNDDDEDLAVARPFLRTASPDNGPSRSGTESSHRGDDDDDDDDDDDEDEDEDDDNVDGGIETEEDGDDDDETFAGDREEVAEGTVPDASSGVKAKLGGASKVSGERKASARVRSGRYTRSARVSAAHDRMGHKMHKYTLYETASRYYIVGEDVTGRRFRVLKIDRTTTTADDAELSITDDKIVYSQKEMVQLLDTIDDGNRGTGGIKVRCTTWGLLGFIRFTGPYYMMLITKRSTVAVIGGHVVYQVTGTELIPLTPGRGADTGGGGAGGGGGNAGAAGNGGGDGSHHHTAGHSSQADEARFLAILNHVNLTQSFYFSYSYDITNTLQHNITQERAALAEGRRWLCDEGHNSMFVWNSHLLQPAMDSLASPFDWCRPITHGYIDQASISIYGRTAYVTIIARRSRYFAGARFLKRGANDMGYVANDVETEQIVSEASTTSFHSPGRRLFANPQYTSYVQHRGSIPLYWTQENTSVTPKPPIELNLVDPFYSAAALHFDDMFERYGAPIYVLNLVKARESTPRESKLLEEFTRCIRYLNQFLPDDKKIIHHAWDMSRANKSRDVSVIGVLEEIAETVVSTTGFFRNGEGDGDTNTSDKESEGGSPNIQRTRVQNGIARTNCIDCLDRTNAAQFVIGKCALGHQLHALGILENPSLAWETDAVNLFTHMYHDHGDTIAVQYGGSQLVNTMETYRKINQWTSHSRDMLETLKRYYNNSFLDGQRQEAYNLFLGNYIYTPGQPMLWDLPTDYYLHHADPRRRKDDGKRRDYIHWFTPENLRRRTLPPLPSITPIGPNLAAIVAARRQQLLQEQQRQLKRKRSGHPKMKRTNTGRSSTNATTLSAMSSKPLSYFDDYWLEFYRPYFLSSFAKMFTFKIKSTMKYIPIKSTRDGQYDLSPFKVRSEVAHHQHHHHQQGSHGGDTDSIASGSTSRRRVAGHKKEVSFVTPQDVASARLPPADTHSLADINEKNEKDTTSVRSGQSVTGGPTAGLRNWLSPSGQDRAASDAASISGSQQHGFQGLAEKGAFPGNGGGGASFAGGSSAADGHTHAGPFSSPAVSSMHGAMASMSATTTATTAAIVTASPSRASGGSVGLGINGSNVDSASQAFNGRYGSDNHAAGGYGRPSDGVSSTLDTTVVSYGGLLFDGDPGQKPKQSTLEKSRQAQLTFAKMVQDSLNPSVKETDDYEQYISHPQNLQIVVSTDVPAADTFAADAANATNAATRPGAGGVSAASNLEYQEYVSGSWKTDGLGLRLPEPNPILTYEDELYGELLRVPENPLTVTEGDAQKKRYKAYRKWLRGKSLFKQHMVDA